MSFMELQKKWVIMDGDLDSQCDFAPECKAEDFVVIFQGCGLSLQSAPHYNEIPATQLTKRKGLFGFIVLGSLVYDWEAPGFGPLVRVEY